MKRFVRDPNTATLVGVMLTLPFAIVEVGRGGLTAVDAGNLVPYGLLWLLSTLIALVLIQAVRNARTAGAIADGRASLILRLALLVAIAVVWIAILVDQMPCFLGVPNCD